MGWSSRALLHYGPPGAGRLYPIPLPCQGRDNPSCPAPGEAGGHSGSGGAIYPECSAQPRQPAGLSANVLGPLHFSMPSTISGIVLAEREGEMDGPILTPRLSSLLRHHLPLGITKGAFTSVPWDAQIPHSLRSLCTNTFTCWFCWECQCPSPGHFRPPAALARGMRGACPITPTPQRPCPARGHSHPPSPGLALALCPAVAVYLVSWHSATCALTGTGGPGCAELSWRSWGCCHLPHPGQAGPSSHLWSNVPRQSPSSHAKLGQPVPWGFSASSRGWSAKASVAASLHVGDTGSGSHRYLLVAPSAPHMGRHSSVSSWSFWDWRWHWLRWHRGVPGGAVCWVQTAAGHSAGNGSASGVQEAGPTTRVPAAREWAGGRSCAKLHHWHLLPSLYPSRGKPSAQQSTL